MVDPGRLRSLLDRLGEEIGHLRRLAAIAPDELLTDPDRVAGVKYRFVVAIETCIDAAQRVIASESLRAPTDFADSFAVLGEADLLSAELVPALQEMAPATCWCTATSASTTGGCCRSSGHAWTTRYFEFPTDVKRGSGRQAD